MTKQQMLNTLQRKHQIARNIVEKIFEEYLETTDERKSKELWSERKAWLYVCYELEDLLRDFGVEVVK